MPSNIAQSLFIFTLFISHFTFIETNDIAIDFTQSRIQKLNSSYFIGQLFFVNLISPYQINYPNLPSGWATSGYYIYIPTYVQKSAPTNQELIVTVSDKTGRYRQFRIYIIIKSDAVYFSYTSQLQNGLLFNNIPSFQILEAQPTVVSASNNTLPQQNQNIQIVTGVVNTFSNASKNNNSSPTQQNTSNITSIQPKVNLQTEPAAPKLSPQQLINSIEKQPQFEKVPITSIQKPPSYEIVTPPTPPLPKIPINQSLPIQERIRLILQAVQAQYNSVPKTMNSETGLITLRPIDSIFAQVPKIPQLKQLLQLPNPGLYLSKSIQQVVSSQLLNCQQKIAYLLETFGITQAHIEILNSQHNQVQITNQYAGEIIDTLKEQLRTVNQQVLTEKQRQIRIQEDLSAGLEELSQLYRLYNEQVLKAQLSLQSSYNPLFAKREQLKLQNQLQAQQNKLNSVDYMYQISQEELKRFEEEYKIKKEQAQYFQVQYNLQKQRVTEAKQKLMKVQEEIRLQDIGSQKYIDQLKLAYLKKEVEISRFKSNLESITLKQNTLKNNMKRIEEQIKKNQQRIDDKKERQLISILQNLKISLPNIQTEVDRIYYRCYRAGNIMIKQNGTRDDNFIYIMKSSEWANYMNNVYGASQQKLLSTLQNRANSSWTGNQEVAIYPHNIFSTVWTKSLGAIQPTDLQKIFQLDFTCLKPSTLETYSGLLKFIWKNILIVQDLKDTNILYQLKLGTCSRIQVVNKVIPENGMLVYWRGNLGQGSYNVYLATIV